MMEDDAAKFVAADRADESTEADDQGVLHAESLMEQSDRSVQRGSLMRNYHR